MNALNNGILEFAFTPLYTKCIWFDYCPIPEFVSTGKLPNEWLNNYCNVANQHCKRYQLENYGRTMPDNLLPDGKIMHHLIRFEE